MSSLKYHLDLDKQSRWNIITPTATAKNGLIYAQEIGDFYAGPDYFTTREGFDSFLIKLTVKGCGILDYGGQQYRVPPGHFFWIDCRNPQHYYTDPAAGSWHVLWVHFYGATAQAYYDAFLTHNNSSPVAAFPVQARGYDIFSSLLTLEPSGSNQITSDLQASGLLTQLASECATAAVQSGSSGDVPQIIRSVRAFLQNHYTEKHTLTSLGTRFNLNPFYLQKQFKRYVGLSPTEFQILLRITRAKELMRSTRRSIGEIAHAVGIENLGYFTRQFKQQEGMTPQEYRKLWPILENEPNTSQ